MAVLLSQNVRGRTNSDDLNENPLREVGNPDRFRSGLSERDPGHVLRVRRRVCLDLPPERDLATDATVTHSIAGCAMSGLNRWRLAPAIDTTTDLVDAVVLEVTLRRGQAVFDRELIAAVNADVSADALAVREADAALAAANAIALCEVCSRRNRMALMFERRTQR
jgi:hypothetical protein